MPVDSRQMSIGHLSLGCEGAFQLEHHAPESVQFDERASTCAFHQLQQLFYPYLFANSIPHLFSRLAVIYLQC